MGFLSRSGTRVLSLPLAASASKQATWAPRDLVHYRGAPHWKGTPGLPRSSLSLHCELRGTLIHTDLAQGAADRGCHPTCPSPFSSPLCPAPSTLALQPPGSGPHALWTPHGQEPGAVSPACPVSAFGLDLEENGASVPGQMVRGGVSQRTQMEEQL